MSAPLSLSSRRTPGSAATVIPAQAGIQDGLLCLGFGSLREAASGCAPDRAVPFLCVPKEKEPKERAPWLAGRPRADCSAVLGLCRSRPTHYASVARCVQTGGAKSVNEARSRAHLQSPALLDGSQGAQEQYGRCFATSHPRLASLRRAISDRSRCSALRCGMALHRPNPCSHTAVKNEERLCFGYFHLARQMLAQRGFAHFA